MGLLVDFMEVGNIMDSLNLDYPWALQVFALSVDFSVTFIMFYCVIASPWASCKARIGLSRIFNGLLALAKHGSR